MLLQEPFTSSRLLLEQTPSGQPPVTPEGFSVLFIGLAVAFILAAIAFLPRFLSLAPLLFDSLFRARGSVSLESSVRASNDRRLVAFVCCCCLQRSSRIITRCTMPPSCIPGERSGASWCLSACLLCSPFCALPCMHSSNPGGATTFTACRGAQPIRILSCWWYSHC